jgi:hypothetical protein
MDNQQLQRISSSLSNILKDIETAGGDDYKDLKTHLSNAKVAVDAKLGVLLKEADKTDE